MTVVGHGRTLEAVIAGLALLAGLRVATPLAWVVQDKDDDGFTLIILHNNDGESKLLPDENSDPGCSPDISSQRNVAVNPVAPAVADLTRDGVKKIILVSHLRDVAEETELGVPGLSQGWGPCVRDRCGR